MKITFQFVLPLENLTVLNVLMIFPCLLLFTLKQVFIEKEKLQMCTFYFISI